MIIIVSQTPYMLSSDQNDYLREEIEITLTYFILSKPQDVAY